MASTRLLEILACLARRQALRTLHAICETQHQISTRKLEQYLEPIGDELAGYAFNLRMEYDALSAKLADAQRLLAQRDAEIERLRGALMSCAKAKSSTEVGLIVDAALESQQAASVGGEREAFEVAMNAINKTVGQWREGKFANPYAQAAWEGWQARAALSPAGGGVVKLPTRISEDSCTTEHELDLCRMWNNCLAAVARLNAKPQFSQQTGGQQLLAPEDSVNVALLLSHAQDLREQGHTERADALIQAAEEYVAILAEVQAAQRGMRLRAGEL